MFNTLETYRHAGKMAAKAARNHDAGALNHWARWRDAAVRLESADDQRKAREAYAQEYTAHARG